MTLILNSQLKQMKHKILILFLQFLICFVPNIMAQDMDLPAINYDNIKNSDKNKIKMYFESAQRGKRAGNLKIMSQNLNSIANIYWQSNQYEEAIEYFNLSIKANETLGNQHAIAGIANFKGMIYADAKKYQKSIDNFELALQYFNKTRRRKDMINTYLNMSLSYKNMPNMEKTISCTEAAFKLAQELNDVEQIADCAGMLASYYNEVNDKKKEKFYFHIYKAFKDAREKELTNSLNKLKLQNALNETEKKTKELELYKNKQQLLLKNKVIIEKDSTYDKLLTQYSAKEMLNELYEETIRQNEIIIHEERRFLNFVTTALIIAAFLLLIIIFLFHRSRKFSREKTIMFDKLLENNVLLLQQKEEIKVQRDELEKQRDFEREQRAKINEQNIQINDSILYARRIQKAVLDSKNVLNNMVSDHFVLLMPRDIVSGDFYWIGKSKNKDIIAVVDCTGHGVPGAFMSLLGSLLLSEVINTENLEHPASILDRLRDKIKTSLKQTGKEDEAKDGMDIALISIDHKTKMLDFAGAYNSLFLYRDRTLSVLKGDRMPIGIHAKETGFTNQSMQLQKNDRLYLFTDGYPDQIGGKNCRKFMMGNFRTLIAENAEKDMKEQKEIYHRTIIDWMKYNSGEFETPNYQVDDILLMGLKI